MNPLNTVSPAQVGTHTKLMCFPEKVALADGVPYRIPEAYFIGDFDALFRGEDIQGTRPQHVPDAYAPAGWVWVACPVCGGEDSAVQHVIGPSRIVRCRECGLEFDNPQAVIPPGALDKFASDIHDTRSSAGSALRAEQNGDILMRGLRTLRPELVGTNLIEIGSASGEFLNTLATRCAWPRDRLLGIEPSNRCLEIAHERYGLDCRPWEFLCSGVEPATARLVVMFNTIEHFPNPRAVLRRVRQVIAPDGLLLIATVPNVACLASKMFPEGFIAKNFPDGQHHAQFSPGTLRRLCESEGFQVAKIDGETRDSVTGRTRATAAWLAYSCGVPLASCAVEQVMLSELRRRLQADALPCLSGSAGVVIDWEENFRDAGSLVEMWQRVIWPSPELSDEFDIWLTPSGGLDAEHQLR